MHNWFNFKKDEMEEDLQKTDHLLDELGAEKDEGTLGEGEHHPAADGALAYIKRWMSGDFKRLLRLQEALASTALSGNRNAQICSETLNRIMNGKAVSDRYILGLAWTMRNLDEAERKKPAAQVADAIVSAIEDDIEAFKK